MTFEPSDSASDVDLSIVVLAWDMLDFTRRCVASIRARTDVAYELIIVDNGSAPEAASFAAEAADVSVLNEENRGFAVGMNQGLALARGEFVAFVNNDTVLPNAWSSLLLDLFDTGRSVGIVMPVVTAAGNAYTVRQAPGQRVITVAPFTEIPSAVLYVMRTSTARDLGGWSEEYPVASSEDLDLLFTVWSNGLDVILDERVLIEHEAEATARSKLRNMGALWRANRELFVRKWSGPADDVPRLATCPPEVFAANREIARVAAVWMGRWFDAKATRVGTVADGGSPVQGAGTSKNSRTVETSAWRRLRDLTPARIRRFLGRRR